MDGENSENEVVWVRFHRKPDYVYGIFRELFAYAYTTANNAVSARGSIITSAVAATDNKLIISPDNFLHSTAAGAGAHRQW